MPVTLTLKNIPDDVYEQLRAAAEAHHRSLNSEVIVCLETMLLPSRKTPEERLARARYLRAQLAGERFTAVEIAEFKDHGRVPTIHPD